MHLALPCIWQALPLLHLRYSSRALLLPFKLPSVGPTNEEELKAFSNMANVLKESSRAVGWAIQMGNTFVDEGTQDIASRILPFLCDTLHGIDPRLTTGYASLLFFAEKVCCAFHLVSTQRSTSLRTCCCVMKQYPTWCCVMKQYPST